MRDVVVETTLSLVAIVLNQMASRSPAEIHPERVASNFTTKAAVMLMRLVRTLQATRRMAAPRKPAFLGLLHNRSFAQRSSEGPAARETLTLRRQGGSYPKSGQTSG
jgi:hypothetical protein